MRIAIALFVLGATLVAGGIYGLVLDSSKGNAADPSRQPVTYARQVLVWIDPDTGCHYLTRDGYITPRLSGDGRQLCIL